ncbi:MAG: ornithine carbamoyltransferase [Desulfobacteraceae bacterium]|nr:ornithine carbamoyltransferase [Desulfobacteraceae bacterium]
MKRDLLTIRDLNKGEILALIDRGLQIKKEGRNKANPLSGYTIGLVFDKASTRTRVSFETAMFRLGGQTLFLSRADMQLSRDETVEDTARVLSRYLDGLVIRTYSQGLVEEMAKWADIPVINALTDLYHPCQVLSDLMTVKEKRGHMDNIRVAWIGDGNNVAHSWINAAHMLGFELILACPPGYHPSPEVLKDVRKNVRVIEDREKAASGADVINTDVWASMGKEDEKVERIKDFEGFQVDQSLVDMAKPDVLVMHCLPAHRGEEITADVIDGPRSVVFDQAENKLHLHQALLEKVLLNR